MQAERVIVLVGAGLSVASGIPTFRGPDGLWEGHEVTEVATPEAWAANPTLVRRFYDARRRAAASSRPNAGHRALARLQQSWGADRVTLVSQNVDGLLGRAGALEVLDLHGTLFRVRCEQDEDHPALPLTGDLPPDAVCAVCAHPLRPDIVWFGELPRFLDRIERALSRADRFLAVGTSGVVYPAAGFARLARSLGVHTMEINPIPSGAPWFDEVVAEGSEQALPRLVDTWLA